MPCSVSEFSHRKICTLQSTCRCDISVDLVLLASSRDGNQVEQNPRDTDLCPHLQIDIPDSGVEGGTHKDIIRKIPAHPHRLPSQDSPEVRRKANHEPINHTRRHQPTKVIDDLREAEEVGGVEDVGGDHGEVEGSEGVAFVLEGFVVEAGNGEAFLPVAGHDGG